MVSTWQNYALGSRRSASGRMERLLRDKGTKRILYVATAFPPGSYALEEAEDRQTCLHMCGPNVSLREAAVQYCYSRSSTHSLAPLSSEHQTLWSALRNRPSRSPSTARSSIFSCMLLSSLHGTIPPLLGGGKRARPRPTNRRRLHARNCLGCSCDC